MIVFAFDLVSVSRGVSCQASVAASPEEPLLELDEDEEEEEEELDDELDLDALPASESGPAAVPTASRPHASAKIPPTRATASGLLMG
jgi:hypothetical protein